MAAPDAEFLYLTTTGRRSGAQREIEIWFTRREERLYLVAEHRERAQWVRNLRALPRVSVRLGRRTFPATARVVDARAEPALARAVRSLSEKKYGWGDGQFSCLESLWTKESSWNYQAYNGSSGATGIPQSLPGDKMASFGADWQTNATTQIAWGLDYIQRAYGTPCAAWGHSQATDWY